MQRTISCLVIALFAWSTQAVETGTIAEVHGCTYLEGKTLADLDAAAAQWLKQFDQIDAGKNYSAAALTPYRANSSYDAAWIGSNPNLNDWANMGEASNASAAMQSAAAAFDAVVSCESGFYFSTTLSNELPVEDNDTETAIEVYTCKINDGKTATDVEAAEKLIVGATKGLGFSTDRLFPWLANTPFDNVDFSVSDDLGAFASNHSKYMIPSADADAAIFSSQSCESGLWMGHLIRRPVAPAQKLAEL